MKSAGAEGKTLWKKIRKTLLGGGWHPPLPHFVSPRVE